MFDQDFYPTPKSLVRKMVEGVDFNMIHSVLEPSAGKGDICDEIKYCGNEYIGFNRKTRTLDVIEINPELQHILRGKGYNLIGDDFLSFDTAKPYDLIIANFPFSDGDAHLLHALELIHRNGGQLICLVNAETIRNPYTRLREIVCRHLNELGASIDFLADQFIDAERPTGVEVALIRATADRPGASSIILDDLQKAEEVKRDGVPVDDLIEKDFLRALVARYILEARLGIRLIDEHEALRPFIANRIKQKGETGDSSPLIELKVRGHSDYGNAASKINEYLPALREKFWHILVHDPRYSGQFTSNIQQDLSRKLTELRNCEFNLFNINQLSKDLNAQLAKGVEKAILDLFDEFSRKFAWDGSIHQKNVHYYNGWKTNQCWKIRNKVIVPMNGIGADYSSKYKFEYRIHEKLDDMVKVFNYLSADKVDVPRLVSNATKIAENHQDFTNVNFRFFTATFYKKHTCHIRFHDKDLLDKFNIFGSQRKGWLPPSYGKAAYDDMSREDRAIVDDFQGREAYAKVMLRPDYFLVEDVCGLLGDGGQEL